MAPGRPTDGPGGLPGGLPRPRGPGQKNKKTMFLKGPTERPSLDVLRSHFGTMAAFAAERGRRGIRARLGGPEPYAPSKLMVVCREEFALGFMSAPTFQRVCAAAEDVLISYSMQRTACSFDKDKNGLGFSD